MIARLLSRYADPRLRRERDNYRALALALADRLKEARADLASERARTQENTGRCGHTHDSWSREVPLVCALPAGHAGWHRDENRAEWTPINQEKQQ